ncbi:hypothetical protein OtV2_152 [Ostreococcus tauri virus 2]|uniref:hypothetical protein n=1 Tax=Ostreococcus tauri virus 2 TaxID=696472 RepID=UPI0001EF4670|nr:hypothetical protein OtV2_152 [Ostreococcus tauri virus 2]CBI70151.1 hypothetical protein OtV2_152 [Ostreococcus tauri virus 2]
MEHTHFIDKEPNKYEALTELLKQHIQSMKEDEVNSTIEKWEKRWDLKTNDFRNAASWDTGNSFTLIILMNMVIRIHRELIFWLSRVSVKNKEHIS